MDEKKAIQNIKDISADNLVEKLRQNSKDNMRGAVIGGVLGLVIGIAIKKNPLITGGVGLIVGRLFMNKKNF